MKKRKIKRTQYYLLQEKSEVFAGGYVTIKHYDTRQQAETYLAWYRKTFPASDFRIKEPGDEKTQKH